MKIGELAKLADVPVETIRYYEQEQLLMPPARSDGNYRVFGREHVERLQFIRYCRSLDITLEEIRVLLKFQDAPNDDCEQVNLLLEGQIFKVAQWMERLAALQQQLVSLRGMCGTSRAVKDCGIMNKLTCADTALDGTDPQLASAGTHSGAPQRAKGKGGSIAMALAFLTSYFPASAPYVAVLA